ncbi:MAG: nucleoside deaminase [Clostridia bacterium]|nr:nucleoside deaminase [Clostridia bacterium]
MEEALRLAREGADMGEIPVGCVIALDGEVIATGQNNVERTSDPTAHAEISAIKEAAKRLGKNLSRCELYVTVEPCAMCAGAIVNAKIGKLYIGTEEPKTGCCGTLYDLVEDARLNSNPRVVRGIRTEECKKLMADFFAARRDK